LDDLFVAQDLQMLMYLFIVSDVFVCGRCIWYIIADI